MKTTRRQSKDRIKDWREQYIICEHVFKNEKLSSRHLRFRVCCEECYKKGFLVKRDLKTEDTCGFCIGKLKNQEG